MTDSYQAVLEAGLLCAKKKGIHNFTAKDISAELGRSYQSIYYYFKSMKDFREGIIKLALDRKEANVIIQLILTDNIEVFYIKENFTATELKEAVNDCIDCIFE